MKILRSIYTVAINVILLPITILLFIVYFFILMGYTKSIKEALNWLKGIAIGAIDDGKRFIKYGLNRGL